MPIHPGVKEVLIDRGELVGELLVQQGDYARIPLHAIPPFSWAEGGTAD
jgi:hypothetical protein